MHTPPALRIRFDGPPSHESGRFVECEDITGKSINAGEWSQDGDYWLLTVRSIPGAAPEFPSIDLSGPSGCAVADAALKAYREKVDAWAKREKEHVDRLLTESARLASAYSVGLDDETIRLARETVILRPPTERPNWREERWVPVALNGQQAAQVRAFMAQLGGQPAPSPYKDIRTHYFGTKRYAHWDCQEIECEFGMGPSHGSVTMSVSLRQPWRGTKAPPVPAANVDASLRALTAILDGKAPVDLLNA